MINYVFTCDGCGLEVELEDLDLSKEAPLPHGWMRMTLAFPADSKGEPSTLFADHWEEEPERELCEDCIRLVKRILREPDLGKLTDEERQEMLKNIQEME